MTCFCKWNAIQSKAKWIMGFGGLTHAYIWFQRQAGKQGAGWAGGGPWLLSAIPAKGVSQLHEGCDGWVHTHGQLLWWVSVYQVNRGELPQSDVRPSWYVLNHLFVALIHAPCHLSPSRHQPHHRDPGQRGRLRPPDRGPQPAGHLAWLWSQISEWRPHQCVPV